MFTTKDSKSETLPIPSVLAVGSSGFCIYKSRTFQEGPSVSTEVPVNTAVLDQPQQAHHFGPCIRVTPSVNHRNSPPLRHAESLKFRGNLEESSKHIKTSNGEVYK
jgi:hypothetical protein